MDHEKQKGKSCGSHLARHSKNGAVRLLLNIADEAGLSVGSMRHYFSTHSELLFYAMKMVSDRVGKRIANIDFSGDLLTDIPLLVDEILPTDEEKRLEMEVWFAFCRQIAVRQGSR
ncbi:hypothetical protein [Paenibacillus sp. FSL M7-0831]|uniref:hypothetical protein n=1 Tax=Paenibacillus sp. FSL M7-0831 TaxID=2975314 RepID=UPI0030F9DB5F